MGKKKLLEYFLLSAVLIGAFCVRLYKINSPVADWHSWRQADTSSVSRNFIKYGFDLLHPRFDDLSNIPSGKENPQGYRFVEFPIYNLFQAGLFYFFPQKSLEWWGRIISIFFSLGSCLFLYFLVKKYLGRKAGLLSTFFFAFLPFNIYYSRVILPEPLMIFTSLGMIYFFSRWIDGEKFGTIFYFLSLTFAIISLLLKPFAAFLFIPLCYLSWGKWRFLSLKKISLYFYFILALIPFFLWRLWMTQYPEGIPAFAWLLNDAGIRFKGAFFYWIFAERFAKLILGYWGLIFFGLGFVAKLKNKESWFFYLWLLSILGYFFVIAGGNVRHDYYQVIAIPVITIFLAKGANLLLFECPTFLNRYLCLVMFVVCSMFMFAFSWYEVRGFFNINHPEIVEAGKAVDKLTPKNAKVIAPYSGDTALLYQTNRQGWPMVTESVDFLISRGANYYVSVSYDTLTQELMIKYPVLEKTDKYVIVTFQAKK